MGNAEITSMPEDRSRERRRLAAECLAAAQATSEPTERAALLAMAQKWLGLANADTGVGRGEAWEKTFYHRVMQAEIGRSIKRELRPSRQMPHRLFTLLLQLEETDNQ
jgi:hypothetical protein